jgi:hypothetical protein
MANSATTRWREFQPSKRFVFWSFVGGIVATLVVGFAVFGWYTAGGARALADNAAEEAQTELASSICVERFMRAPDAAVQLTALKEESTWSRDTFIEDGGWTTFKGYDEPLSEAAEACADMLVEMEAPAAASTTASDAS